MKAAIDSKGQLTIEHTESRVKMLPVIAN
jgi:hypothetical protein